MRHQIALALIALFITSTTFADPARPSTHPAPTPDRDELAQTGAMVVVRWDALLDEKSADSIASLGVAQSSDSKLYHAMLFSGSTLRFALAQARSHKGILATGREVNFAKSQPGDARLTMDRPFFVQLIVRKPRPVLLQCRSSDHEAFDPPDQNGVRILLNHPNLQAQLNEQRPPADSTTQPAEQAIIYDGHVQPGQALAFLAAFTGGSGFNYYHLLVYEPFRADGWEQPQISSGGSGISADWWIQSGPQKLRALADVAAVWASRAKHAPVDPPAAWSIILPNGAGVRLLGFCYPKQHGFCWWDPDGNPIDAPMHVGLNSNGRTPYLYAIETRGSKTEPESPLPPADAKPPTGNWTLSVPGLPPSHEIKVILGEGPWRQVGEFNPSHPLTVGNVTYTVKPMSDNSFNFVPFERNIYTDDLMDITLVLKDGREIGSEWTDEGQENAIASFWRVQGDNVKTFHLWLRKGHVVTFKGFALAPNIRPPLMVTRDQVIAVENNHPTTAPEK